MFSFDTILPAKNPPVKESEEKWNQHSYLPRSPVTTHTVHLGSAWASINPVTRYLNREIFNFSIHRNANNVISPKTSKYLGCNNQKTYLWDCRENFTITLWRWSFCLFQKNQSNMTRMSVIRTIWLSFINRKTIIFIMNVNNTLRLCTDFISSQP
jgi:hypothetical protein